MSEQGAALWGDILYLLTLGRYIIFSILEYIFVDSFLQFTVAKPKITSPLPQPDLNCTASGRNISTYLDPGAGYCVSGAGGLGRGLTSKLGLGIAVLLIVSKMAL